MFTNFPFFPQQASVQAGQVDAIYFFMVAVTAFFSLLIGVLVVFFAAKYRRRHRDEIGVAIHGSLPLELLWTFIPLGIVMIMFGWGAKVFFNLYRTPAGAMEIFVVGKQWMWKVQHMEGQREINELHVPVGRPVKLIMGSEDVLHSYYIPAFRVKADVIPGRYNTMWFQASQAGEYRLFCAEYCGTKHSGMIGRIVAMEPADFQAWLGGGRSEDSPVAAGAKLFQDLACHTCHAGDTQGRGPVLTGVYGKPVQLQGGTTVMADDAYIRESIVLPQAKVVAGFQPVMPTFQGLVTEEQLLQLIAYVRSLGQPGAAPGTPAATTPGAPGGAPQVIGNHMDATAPHLNYLNNGHGLASWLLTRDHKRIALLYLISITAFFAIGGFFALMIRLELLTPTGDLMAAETYNKMFTMHGVVMVFFFLIPSIPAVLGNFLIPIMIGAKDLAFPRINLLSWYVYIIGGVFTMYAALSGGVDTGWTFYTPYSTAAANSHVMAAALGIFITGFSSILTGLNFIVTIHRMRAPGMTWFRLPLFVWAHYATSLIMILGTPVIAITVLMVAAERALHLGIFDPALGGDPVLFQHLFWFYSHPAVYIMVLPAMGVVSELVQAFARKNIFGYSFIAYSSLAIAIIGFGVWGHHIFVAGQSVYAGMIFSFISYLVAIPSAIKVFNWTATIYKGSVSLDSPMLYAFGFVGLFTIGGLTGLFLAAMGLDIHVHDTYFVVAHFHYIMVGGAILGYLGGLHYWWPKITGRLYSEPWAKVAAIVVFVGFNLTFFPQFLAGYLGMPRRYHAYPPEYQVFNILSTAGASVLALGYVIPLFYLTASLVRGAKAPADPWGAKGLEWEIPSPPPTENFAVTPIVTHGTHQYEPSREVGIV